MSGDPAKCGFQHKFDSLYPLVSGSLVSVPSAEYRNLDSMSFDFRIVSVFCLRVLTANTYHASVFGFFW